MGGLWGIQSTPPQDSETLLCLEALVCAGGKHSKWLQPCRLRDERAGWDRECLAESLVRKPNLGPLDPETCFQMSPYPNCLSSQSLGWGPVSHSCCRYHPSVVGREGCRMSAETGLRGYLPKEGKTMPPPNHDTLTQPFP